MMNGNSTTPVCVVFTVDTEPDNAWENHLNPSVANVRELLQLQELLAKYGAKVTCLVTYRVIQDEDAVEVLRELVESGGAEIGAHLHPWENPPFMESGLDVKYHTYPHELPLAAFEEKLAVLTEAITERFGRPTAYRAGRWGLAAGHIPILERLGYEVDTSVTPLEDWRETLGIPKHHGGLGGIDYRFAPRDPYHPSYSDVRRVGDARIVEIPLTVAFHRRTSRYIQRNYAALPLLLKRVLWKLEILRPVQAFPAWERADHLVRMLRVNLSAAAPLINIAMHSSELMLNGSPCTRTAAELKAVFHSIETMVALLASSGTCEFLTLTAGARAWKVRAGRDSGPGK